MDRNEISTELYKHIAEFLQQYDEDEAIDIMEKVNSIIKEQGIRPAKKKKAEETGKSEAVEDPDSPVSTVICPHCGSHHVVSNGSVRGNRRFVCKSCKKSFGLSTGKIVVRSRNTDKFDKFLRGMINGDTLRRLSEDCDISITTAYQWRHKVMELTRDCSSSVTLSGKVEEDEIYLVPSFKGNKKAFLNRLDLDKNSDEYKAVEKDADDNIVPDYKKYGYRHHAHIRGRAGQRGNKKGLSADKICCATAIDDSGNVIGKPVGNGNVSAKGLEYAFSDRIDNSAVYITDKSSGSAAFAAGKEFSHVALKADEEARFGEYNLQKINNFHSSIRKVTATSKAFASKYAEDYLSWYGWLSMTRDMSTEERISMIKRMQYGKAENAMTLKSLAKRELPAILRKDKNHYNS